MGQTIIDISTPNDGLGDPLRHAFDLTNQMFTELYANKVDKISGKGLSSNDYTTAEQTKLAGIAEGAEVNVQADLLQEDDTQDDFVKGKESIGLRTDPQIEIYAGVSVFTLPEGAIVNSVLLVRTPLWEIDEWTQTDDQLTITKTMNTGNRIQINFY
jgi:hypothetical protein